MRGPAKRATSVPLLMLHAAKAGSLNCRATLYNNKNHIKTWLPPGNAETDGSCTIATVVCGLGRNGLGNVNLLPAAFPRAGSEEDDAAGVLSDGTPLCSASRMCSKGEWHNFLKGGSMFPVVGAGLCTCPLLVGAAGASASMDLAIVELGFATARFAG